jgi:hypothetical protein
MSILRARGWALAAIFATPMALAQAPSPDTLPDAEWHAIRTVVEAQREALVAGNAERAFSYASRGIREQFGDAPAFLAMVLESYAALVEARDATLLDGAVIGGRVIQPMRLVLPDNTVMIALYTMVRGRGGGWRIGGCILAPSTLKAV